MAKHSQLTWAQLVPVGFIGGRVEYAHKGQQYYGVILSFCVHGEYVVFHFSHVFVHKDGSWVRTDNTPFVCSMEWKLYVQKGGSLVVRTQTSGPAKRMCRIVPRPDDAPIPSTT